MARIQFSHKSFALAASFSVRQSPNAPFVLFCPTVRPRVPCGCRRRYIGFPSASSWPRPSGDRSALSVSRTNLPSQSPSLLILVFVEDGLRADACFTYRRKTKPVLILVLVEDGLRVPYTNIVLQQKVLIFVMDDGLRDQIWKGKLKLRMS